MQTQRSIALGATLTAAMRIKKAEMLSWPIALITDKFDVLRGRLLGNHNDFLFFPRSRPRKTSNLSFMISVVTQG